MVFSLSLIANCISFSDKIELITLLSVERNDFTQQLHRMRISHDPSMRKSCKNIQSVVVIDVLFSWNWVRLLIRLTLPRREEERCRLSRWNDNVKWTERNNRLPCHGHAWLIPHQMVFFLKFIHKTLILFVLRRRKTTAGLLFDVTTEFFSLGLSSMLKRLIGTPWKWENSIISRLRSLFMSERIKSLEDIFSFFASNQYRLDQSKRRI